MSRTNVAGFKKKRLGHPSEKLLGDVPHASWRTVLASEVIIPICNAALFVIAYIFVKSFLEKSTKTRASPLIRIAIAALGPILWNAAILLVLFFICFLHTDDGEFRQVRLRDCDNSPRTGDYRHVPKNYEVWRTFDWVDI